MRRLPGPVAVRPGERLRLRIVNTANARVFGLRFEDVAVSVVALDGQPVAPHTPGDGRVLLGPGMRADLIVDVPGDAGRASKVVDNYYEDTAYTLTTLVPPASCSP